MTELRITVSDVCVDQFADPLSTISHKKIVGEITSDHDQKWRTGLFLREDATGKEVELGISYIFNTLMLKCSEMEELFSEEMLSLRKKRQ